MTATAGDDGRTPFDRVGGFAVVRRLVMDFYDRVLDSDIVGHHFDNVDMPRLIDHQTRFLSGLLGGPATIEVERVGRAHRHLGITHAEFDEIGFLLDGTLLDGRVAATVREDVMAFVEALRSTIVCNEVPA